MGHTQGTGSLVAKPAEKNLNFKTGGGRGDNTQCSQELEPVSWRRQFKQMFLTPAVMVLKIREL